MKKVFIVVLVLFCSSFIYGQNSKFVKNVELPKFKTSILTKIISEKLVGFKESSDCGRVEVYYIQFENQSENQSVIKYEKNKKPEIWFYKICYRFLIQQLKISGFNIVKSI